MIPTLIIVGSLMAAAWTGSNQVLCAAGLALMGTGVLMGVVG